MTGYYSEQLNTTRLKDCYRIAPPRVQQYLDSELDFVTGFLDSRKSVIEMGCGYGRILPHLADNANQVFGIDTSLASIHMARQELSTYTNIRYAATNAASTGFADNLFDVVVCIQNGISAFNESPLLLVTECYRIAKPGGTVLISTYSEKFWDHRLEWFRLQADAELLGEIDEERTGDGTIACKDGFRAITFTPEQFEVFTSDLPGKVHIQEVDESSLFCVVEKDR